MHKLFAPLDNRKGQTLFQTALFLPLLFVVIGLVVDGGLAFADYRHAQITADLAAHAASHRIDPDVFAATNQVVLDYQAALDAAVNCASRNSGGQVTITSITLEPRMVTVEGNARLRTIFMRIVGVPEITVRVVGKAYPAYGIEWEGQ